MPDLDLTIERQRLEAVRAGSAVVVDHPAVFHVTGPGALTCLQGLFTNDLEHPGEGSLTYGAMLTPKGMIVVDAWVLRQGGAVTLIAPAAGRDPAREIFQKALPPRLAKAEDLTGEFAVAWVLGAHGLQTLVQAGIGAPDSAGRVLEHDGAGGPLLVALAPDSAPFGALLSGSEAAVESVVRRLLIAGALRGEPGDLEAARILAGWPALGTEIDEKTLPQEVRYDRDRGRLVHQGLLHRAGNRGAHPFPGPHQSRAARSHLAGAGRAGRPRRRRAGEGSRHRAVHVDGGRAYGRPGAGAARSGAGRRRHRGRPRRDRRDAALRR